MDQIKIENIKSDDEVGEILHKEIYNQYCPNYVSVGEDCTTLGISYVPFAEEIKQFEVRDSDIWVASYPKSGTTWAQEMIWMIMNDVDIKTGRETTLDERFPFLESCTILNADKFIRVELFHNIEEKSLENSIVFAHRQEAPRFIKTHLPASLLPDQIKNGTKSPKMIYVMRNPKDVCVSYYHHGNLFQGWRTNMENFAKVFLADKAQYGSYWNHVLSYWAKRHSPNLLIIKYEDMKSNLSEIIKKAANFLEKELDQYQIATLCEHLSFESMKNNESVNREMLTEVMRKFKMAREDGHFMRSGVVGKYKEELSSETIKKFNSWIADNIVGTSFEEEYNFDL